MGILSETVTDRVLKVSLKTVSVLNKRWHWAVRAKHIAHERGAIRLAVLAGNSKWPILPVTVTLCRVAPRYLDSDNLAGALKAVRDEVAESIWEIDDRDERVEWRYEQRLGAKKEYAVEISAKRR